MLPRNFPGRVNARRKVALNGLSKRDFYGHPFDPELFDTLSSRIMTDDHARSIRTKIRRESP